MRLEIIIPSISEGDAIADGLRFLTKCIFDKGLREEHGYGLGGRYGYGTDFENETFMMHHYCWCERDDCQWCAGCECPDTAYHYFVDGREVGYREWIGIHKRLTEGYEYGTPEYEAGSNEANRRRSTRHDAECRYCRGEFGGAPHFLHKPTGSRVTWYKYIGRDQVEQINGKWAEILRDCLVSIEWTPTP